MVLDLAGQSTSVKLSPATLDLLTRLSLYMPLSPPGAWPLHRAQYQHISCYGGCAHELLDASHPSQVAPSGSRWLRDT